LQTDLDGQSDILKVFFNSFLPPNGSPASGNPFFLYDDGNANTISGDQIPGMAIMDCVFNCVKVLQQEEHIDLNFMQLIVHMTPVM